MDKIKERIESNYYFNLEYILKYAFEIIKTNGMVISIYSVMYILSSLLLLQVSYNVGIGIMGVITGPFVAGYYYAFDMINKKDRLQIQDFFMGFRNPAPFIILNLLTGIITALGLYLMILPGIYFAIAYFFAIPFMVFFRLDFWQYMEASRKIITKKWGMFFLLILILMIINVIGALLYGFGLIFTIPFTYAAIFVAFRAIFPETEDAETESEENKNELDINMFR